MRAKPTYTRCRLSVEYGILARAILPAIHNHIHRRRIDFHERGS
jgi:hypothetical protein